MSASDRLVKERIGREIRRWRDHAGLSQYELGKAVLRKQNTVSAWERGKRLPEPDDLQRLDAALSTGGALVRLWHGLTTRNAYAAWFRDVVAIEAESSESREYNSLVIPGLLQTEDYARELTRQGGPTLTSDEVSKLVTGRRERSRLITGGAGPVAQFIIEEHVLRRPIGSIALMCDQLGHLLDMSEFPRVTIQVIPMGSTLHPGMDGPFILFTVPQRGMVAYVESRYTSDPRDDREVTDGYMAVWSELKGVALPIPESTNLIRKIRKELNES